MSTILNPPAAVNATPAPQRPARKPYVAPRPRDRAARLAHLVRKAESRRHYNDTARFSYAATQKAWHGAASGQYRAAEAMWLKVLGIDDRRVERLRRALAGLAAAQAIGEARHDASDPAKAPSVAQDEPAGLGTGGLPVGPDDADRAFWSEMNAGGFIQGELSDEGRNLGSLETLWDVRNREVRVALAEYEDRWA